MTWHLPESVDRMRVDAALTTLTERYDRDAANVVAYAFHTFPADIPPQEFLHFHVHRRVKDQFFRIYFSWIEHSNEVLLWILTVRRRDLEPVALYRIENRLVRGLFSSTWKQEPATIMFLASDCSCTSSSQ